MVGHMMQLNLETVYIEGVLDKPVTAKFMRVLFTADYNARFLVFSEIEINDGGLSSPEIILQ